VSNPILIDVLQDRAIARMSTFSIFLDILISDKDRWSVNSFILEALIQFVVAPPFFQNNERRKNKGRDHQAREQRVDDWMRRPYRCTIVVGATHARFVYPSKYWSLKQA
jgi:hypothetical protein